MVRAHYSGGSSLSLWDSSLVVYGTKHARVSMNTERGTPCFAARVTKLHGLSKQVRYWPRDSET